MPGMGERPLLRRPSRPIAALLIVASALAVLGAAGPAALRAMDSDAVADQPGRLDMPLPELPTGVATAAPHAPALYPAEDLRGQRAARPPDPEQAARVSELPPRRGERDLPPPRLTPGDPTWVARRLEIPALGVSVSVAVAGDAAAEDFPPQSGAFILRASSQPGRGTNSYIFAHANPHLFKPLWVAQVGQQVIVTMSDGQQLGYRVTAVVRNIPCPDPSVHKPARLPPVLANATKCDTSWTAPTATERLTLQTSQGFNRNYGEMVVIAKPDW